MRLRHISPTGRFANHCFLRFDCRPLRHVQCSNTFWLWLRLWLFLSIVTFTLHSCVMFHRFQASVRGYSKIVLKNHTDWRLKPKDLLAKLSQFKFDDVRFWHLYRLAEPGDAQQQTPRARFFSFAKKTAPRNICRHGTFL